MSLRDEQRQAARESAREVDAELRRLQGRQAAPEITEESTVEEHLDAIQNQGTHR